MPKGKETVMLKLSDIVPDENQPRKLFDPEKLKNLQNSIREHGMMNPLRVEKFGDKYLIEDGERRYRAAKELGMKEVEAIILEPMEEKQRRIRQFHVQNQNEEWTATEKASVVYELSKDFKMTIRQMSELLGLGFYATERYFAFANLMDKEGFQRKNMGIEWAKYLNALRKGTKDLSQNVLEVEFTKKDEKDFEKAVIDRILNGELSKPAQMSKIKDSFTKNPKLIREFIDTAVTVDSMFIKSKAKGAYALRNMITNARYAQTHAARFMEIKDVKATKNDIDVLKNTIKHLKTVIDYFDQE